MGIGNIGLSELLIVAVIVLLFFGPRRLPEIGRSVGSALREFKKGMNEVKRELEEVERSAKGEQGSGSGSSGSERGERPTGKISPPRGIDEAPTFGGRRESEAEARAESGGEEPTLRRSEPAEEDEPEASEDESQPRGDTSEGA